MARKLDPKIAEVLKGYGFGPDACWDCHGVWVIYHRIVEQIAAKAGIQFDQPHIVEADSANGIAAVCVTGRLGETSMWSIGEASPKNNKNAYCWAMAEKRAIDRVVLKLIGLYGDIYSEEEADDFRPTQRDVMKAAKDAAQGKEVTTVKEKIDWRGPLGKTALGDDLKAFAAALADNVHDHSALNKLLDEYDSVLDQCRADMPGWWTGQGMPEDFVPLKRRIEAKRSFLDNQPNTVLGGY